MYLAGIPFSIPKHKEMFKYPYLEVVISPLGVIEYASPSHMLTMARKMTEKTGLSYEEQNDLVTQDYYADMILWYSRMTGYIAVWDKFFDGEPNEKQLQVLTRLKREGLYFGDIFSYGFITIKNIDEISKLSGKTVEVLKKFPTNVNDKEILVRIIIHKEQVISYDKKSYLIRFNENFIRGLFKGALTRRDY